MMFWRKRSPVAETPIQSTPPTPAPEVEPEPELTDFETTFIGPRKKILIVDDDPVTVKALSHKLRSRGFHVVSAPDGSSALNATRNERPDLMLLDVNLPPDVGCVEWNGFRVAQWVQRMEEGRNIPVIVMSVSDRQEYRENAMLSGATAFFCKQSDNDQMFATIDSALRGNATVAVSNRPSPVFEI